MRFFLLWLIRLYQKTLSPDHSWVAFYYPFGVCAFRPTCSEYSYDAIRLHGTVKGLIMTVKRVLRCHPGVQPTFDPVTLPKKF